MGEQPTSAKIEEESVAHDEADVTPDTGEHSYGYVPEASEAVDEPDLDLATEVPQPAEESAEEPAEEPEEPEKKVEEPPAEEEVEEHPEVDKEALEKDIAELQEKARIARERAEYWTDAKRQARADHFQGRDAAQPATGPTPEESVGEPPKEEDYEDYNEYVGALTDYKVELKMAEYDRETKQRAVSDAYAEKRENLALELEKGAEKYSDFDEIVRDPIVPITEAMVEILADTEKPIDIAYYLGKNLAECTKISRMPPLAAATAIGKIEAKITAEEESPSEEPPPATPKPTETKKTTTAPAPIKPVKGGSSVVSKDPSKMSNEEYRAARKAGTI